ncbi:MAG TPA: hypothetical protein VFU47_17220, partial [Armatimonadota bacterium]|nr:hypothetical protein [Armatimonadota bacterium]
MSRGRWQHLDRRRPAEARPSPPPRPPGGAGESASEPAAPDPAVAAARGYFHLRQFAECANALYP